MSEQGQRTILLAYKDLDPLESTITLINFSLIIDFYVKFLDLEQKDEFSIYNVEKEGLTIFCVLGIRDLIRMSVPEAVSMLKRAGIKIWMVTGDNAVMAKAIGKECNIFQSNDKTIVLEGSDFINRIGGVVCKNCNTNVCDCAQNEGGSIGFQKIRKNKIKNPQAFKEICEDIEVLARCRPDDKYALVVGLQEGGHVVAMTGDGTNDVPALKAANVGISMGITSTDLAREASDLILLDNSFMTVVHAVLWGRNIYLSIRKSLQFQMTFMIVAVCITLIGAFVLRQNVFSPIQMIWV